MANWYKKYLTIYGKPFYEVPEDVKSSIRNQLNRLQSPNPLISVVVIAYNEECRLAACLWSLSELNTKFPIEILGVNNNSKDKTEEVYQALGLPYYNETRQSPGLARQCTIRTDIRRGEDGSLALSLKKFGKIAFLYDRKARPVTGYGTVGNQSMWQSFMDRTTVQLKGITRIFHSTDHYEDSEDNLVKNK